MALERKKMIIMKDARNYIYLDVEVRGNVSPNDDDNSSSQLDLEEITKDFWIKKNTSLG